MLYGVWVARLVVIWCLSGCGLVFGCWLFFFFWGGFCLATVCVVVGGDGCY